MLESSSAGISFLTCNREVNDVAEYLAGLIFFRESDFTIKIAENLALLRSSAVLVVSSGQVYKQSDSKTEKR